MCNRIWNKSPASRIPVVRSLWGGQHRDYDGRRRVVVGHLLVYTNELSAFIGQRGQLRNKDSPAHAHVFRSRRPRVQYTVNGNIYGCSVSGPANGIGK